MKGLLALVAIFAVCLQVEAGHHLIKSGVNCDEKQAAINAHNAMRRKLAKGEVAGQPKASNMNSMVWDDALAEIAQKWANKMKFAHNQNRKDGRFYVGENIYMSMNSAGSKDANDASNKADFDSAVQSWFDENKDYEYGPYVFAMNTGHYTQLAWAKTIYVGCGHVSFLEDGTYKQIIVCDYGPGGNMAGENVYDTGAGCETLCCQEQCDLPQSGASC